MPYKIYIDSRAIKDVQNSIDYYDEQVPALGKKFENEVDRHLTLLKSNPFFQIRYDNVRCLPLKKFPFLIHFTINEIEQTVIIRAVFHTSLSPSKWKRNTR